jgi:hypothetical protein
MSFTNEEIANQLADYLARQGATVQQLQTWFGGAANGGTAGDGKFPITNNAGQTINVPSPARAVYDASQLKNINLSGVGPHTLTLAQAGNRIRISTGTSPALTEVRLPSAPEGTIWFWRQTGSGPLRFIMPSGATLYNRQGHNGSAGQYAGGSIGFETTSTVFLDGDTAAV